MGRSLFWFSKFGTGYQELIDYEVTIPVEVSEVKPNFDGHLYNAIHLSCSLVQALGETKIDVMACFKSVFRRSGLLWLAQTDMPHTLFASGLGNSACLSLIHHVALTEHTEYS
jgi:hypothetical protein